jgi:hypothetical protein
LYAGITVRNRPDTPGDVVFQGSVLVRPVTALAHVTQPDFFSLG